MTSPDTSGSCVWSGKRSGGVRHIGRVGAGTMRSSRAFVTTHGGNGGQAAPPLRSPLASKMSWMRTTEGQASGPETRRVPHKSKFARNSPTLRAGRRRRRSPRPDRRTAAQSEAGTCERDERRDAMVGTSFLPTEGRPGFACAPPALTFRRCDPHTPATSSVVAAAFRRRMRDAAGPGPPPRAVVQARDARGLDVALDRVLTFRDGVLAEALSTAGAWTARTARRRRRGTIAELSLCRSSTRATSTSDRPWTAISRSRCSTARSSTCVDRARSRTALRRSPDRRPALAFLADPGACRRPMTIDLLASGVDGVYPARHARCRGHARRAICARPPDATRPDRAVCCARAASSRQVLDPVAQEGRAPAPPTRRRSAPDEFARRAGEEAPTRRRRRATCFGAPGRSRARSSRRSARHSGVDARRRRNSSSFGGEMLDSERSANSRRSPPRIPPGGRGGRRSPRSAATTRTPAAMPAEALADAESPRATSSSARASSPSPRARHRAHRDGGRRDVRSTYPFAAYSWRPRDDRRARSGRYVRSPGRDVDDAPSSRSERLRGNCRAWTRVVAPHETWPGHHLQFWVADHTRARASAARATTSVFVEGWGLYCEGLLCAPRLLHEATPERLARLVMRVVRARRA